jgi:V8-like Glu-specific endopeptidase
MSSESLEIFVKRIHDQIVAGEIQLALDQLQNYLSGAAPRLNNEVSLQASRYNRLRQDQRKGLLSRDVEQAELNKLVNDVLDLLEEIPRQVSQAMAPAQTVMPSIKEWDFPVDLEPETILHVNVLKQISWIQHAIEVSKSVCRVLTSKGLGTGFLIAPNLLMTNNHVIPDPDAANQAQAEFNYQQDITGKYLRPYRYRLNPAMFHTSPLGKLDYTIVGIEPATELPSLESWGYLGLTPSADPIPSEHVVIIQHPNGGLKQIALTANQVIKLNKPYILYTTDTMPGSSGAPVFNDLWQVIAIHHAGVDTKDKDKVRRYTNEGILMSAIKADAGSYWPS